jgi:hypothetical protein
VTRTDDGAPGRPGGGDGEDPRFAQFFRGLTIGALVGAAIAGSAIWRRRVARSNELAAQRVGGGSARPSALPPGKPATSTLTGPRAPALAGPSAPERPAPG